MTTRFVGAPLGAILLLALLGMWDQDDPYDFDERLEKQQAIKVKP